MKKQIDDLGRIVIPKEMRRELKLDNGSTVNVELVEDSIVLTNPGTINYKERVDKAINWVIKYQTEWCQDDEVIRDLKQLLEILKGE